MKCLKIFSKRLDFSKILKWLDKKLALQVTVIILILKKKKIQCFQCATYYNIRINPEVYLFGLVQS